MNRTACCLIGRRALNAEIWGLPAFKTLRAPISGTHTAYARLGGGSGDVSGSH